MKPTATGRILLWRGGSLWIGLAGEPAGFHAHHAVQIALPFPGGQVRFQTPSGRWMNYTAALVLADRPHAFEARAQRVAQIFVEPESRDGRSLQARFRSEAIAALPQTLEKHVAALANAYEGRASNEALVALARAAISALADIAAAPRKPPDQRIVHAVELIHRRVGDAIALKEMAAAVHLSPERFRHLFMQETGIAFRAYLLWLRLERSLAAYVAGKALTEAAQSGGFSDSAHLSRTFKRMFGITPGSVRPE
jgi:AraC family transcriptional regulator